ncbi:MAG: hypothetical protein QF577_03915 [Phycisphaerae bacterium]|nr:hypothetical protein [Phycisphaerae bacterium]
MAVELEGAVIELNSLHEQFGLEKAEDTIASMDWMKDQINSFKEHTNQPMGALLDDDIIDD